IPGRLFQVSISERFSGLSSGKLPRIAKRFGYLAAASSEILPEFGSQPGGCSRQASTPAESMSRMHSSALYKVTWRCDGLVGGPADQMWTCASTINMAFLLTLSPSLHTLARAGPQASPALRSARLVAVAALCASPSCGIPERAPPVSTVHHVSRPYT